MQNFMNHPQEIKMQEYLSINDCNLDEFTKSLESCIATK